MAIDFRADQVRLNRLISSGSTPILIYPSSSASDLSGGQTAGFITSSVGTDVFLFVSGATDGTGKTLFGGDAVVSGNIRIDQSLAQGSSVVASGQYSHAQGGNTQATGIQSHAEGFNTLASGIQSHAEGNSTQATGFMSHTEGNTTVASAMSSHAEGEFTTASGQAAHAEGSGTTAGPNSYAHAEGLNTLASGYGSHAEGYFTTASINYAHAEGSGSVASGIASHAEGYMTTASGQAAHAEGYITDASGIASHAEGSGSVASGIASHAEGISTLAFGTGSFAAGMGTWAFGTIDGNPPTITQAVFGKYNVPNNTDSLFVVGDGLNTANRRDILRVNSGSVQVTGSFVAPNITGSLSGTVAGNPFIVAGSNITTNYNSLGQWEITGSGGGGGTNFFTEIDGSTIYTTSSVLLAQISASLGAIITGSVLCEGTFSQGNADNNSVTNFSFANGNALSATGTYSHAEGIGNNATNDGAHAEGYSSTASGYASHAEGRFATASGQYSHAEGLSTQAQADYSHAEGSGSVATGIASHAQGWNTTANGTGSFSAGLATIAYGSIDGLEPTTIQAAFGKYNISNSDSLFVVGDGLDGSNRHDVLRINSGSVQITGSLEVLGGITGSISGTVAGNPFIIAGSNITTNYNSLGQWEITGSGGGSSSPSFFSLVKASVSAGSNGGSYTSGVSFYLTQPLTCSGVTARMGTFSSRAWKASLWKESGSELLATVTQTIAANGVVTFNFTSSVNLSEYERYLIGIWDTTASNYFSSTFMSGVPSRPFYGGSVVWVSIQTYGNGDQIPTTGGSDTYAIDPILTT